MENQIILKGNEHLIMPDGRQIYVFIDGEKTILRIINHTTKEDGTVIDTFQEGEDIVL